MEKTESIKKRFGLLGRNIAYSFSQSYFTQKFQDLGLNNYTYENFDIQTITEVEGIFKTEGLKGLNVTIPYKEEIIPYLNDLDATAKEIGAVNTIKLTSDGLKGYNTDAHGFKTALKPFLEAHHTQALVLGTGGASKAVLYVLDELGIEYSSVSRSNKKGHLSYQDLDENIIKTNTLIINCTPLGTYPNIDDKPKIPYEAINEQHFLFDLIYNPEKTAFLGLGEQKGATICNGHTMLIGQAEKAWEIWNTP